jgi:hypothetical protein
MNRLLIGGLIGTAVAVLFRRIAVLDLLRQRARATGQAEHLQTLTKDELYARAQEADIPGRSEMTKDELAKALTARA